MLSVLIPVREWDPSQLVNDLHAQLVACGQPFEILVSDDGLPDESSGWAGEITRLDHVRYFSRETALGRSANRNFLAARATYDYLLFMDGDAGVARPDYIENYLGNAVPGAVLCGGTLYAEYPPANPKHLLRWFYGKNREQVSAKMRMRNPWKSFSTFNFLIPASLFSSIRFDESVTGYGHEDTLFGIHLRQAGIPIIHLDNGLYHLGLEPAFRYLEKITESGENLARLYRTGAIPVEDVQDISLLKAWIRLSRLGLDKPMSRYFRHKRRTWEKRLSGPRPSLFLLDLFKLGSLCNFN